MAEEESIMEHTGTHEVAVHVRDYERVTKLLTKGARTCLVIGLIVLMIL